ncbi:hypothetical protein [Rhizobium sp. BK176]|uniref:hypothetical protein n=1 Tax=Rhizobium sp. BK176 TaxID=2587071 RepID=UPI002167763A|nr:hypothetical protein [Rhizobium sp. BK176]MCS4088983.1 hypothetical protein [Rhizobium sp. BK176]
MNALNVTLSTDGAFEINSPYPGKRDYKIIHDGSDTCHPWKVISELGESGVWRDEDTFQNLDEAMDWAVSLSTEIYPVPGYGVTLPCGTFFARPGRVKIEDVMASIGWAYVTSVDGWSPVTYPKGTPKSVVESYFQDMVEDTASILGSIDLCNDNEDEPMDMWIADITIPVDGFIQTDRAIETFKAIFEQEGVTCTGSFDYATRINVAPHSANVIDFVPYLKARETSPAPRKAATSAEAGR